MARRLSPGFRRLGLKPKAPTGFRKAGYADRRRQYSNLGHDLSGKVPEYQLFMSMEAAKEELERWRNDYNNTVRTTY